jgi:DNA-directed RNA polymerase subunit alpha
MALDETKSFEQTSIEVTRATEQYARITISPLEGGYGPTLGNALRRVLLSSLNGAAITSVKLADVYHEFSVIPGAREDTTRLILNLKQVRFKPLGGELDAAWQLSLNVRGDGVVTAADLRLPPDLEIVNPEQPLLTLDASDAEFQMEATVCRGVGYSPAEERDKLAIGELPVDAIFSPVRRVAYQVRKTRVGQLADHDSLVMDIWTDGTVEPQDAVREASRVLAEQFASLAGFGSEPQVAETAESEGIPLSVYETAIEELDLSVRAYNCLKRAGLTRVGEILERMVQGDEEMLVIRNFGQKSLDELKEALVAKGFSEYLTVPEEDDGDESAESDDDTETQE